MVVPPLVGGMVVVGVLVELTGVLDGGAEELSGGVLVGAAGFFVVVFAGGLDWHGVADLVDCFGLAVWLAGGALPVRGASGITVPDGLGVTDAVPEGDVLGDPLPVVEDDGDGLAEWLAGGGLTLPVREVPCWVHAEMAGAAPAIGVRVDALLAPEASCEPPPSPRLPLCGADPPPEEPDTLAEPDVASTCGRLVSAKAPAATTKIAVPMAAIGRSQAYPDRACPGLGLAGRKRSAMTQMALITGRARRLSQPKMPVDQADAAPKDSIGRFNRARIRSSPSADGSMESAAACSARRRASS
ncbi:MAG: hypothetical protein ACRDNZ_18890 [Streptosporangiaceae bacterium]